MSSDVCVLIEHLRGQISDISYVMLAAARGLAESSGGKVLAILLGHDAQDLAQDLLAEEVLYVDHTDLADFTPDTYEAVLVQLMGERQPRAILLGHTSIGTDVAGALSVRLKLPLVSSCRQITPDGKYVSQICGGKIMAEGELPTPSAVVTMAPGGYKPDQGKGSARPKVTAIQPPSLAPMRTKLSRYIEPAGGDVDISKETLLVAVGRGIQNQANISLAEELAKALGGVVTGSRPVIDQGWLPTSRLVGKSGKHVKPKIYLALGISGAPEHVEAITDSDTIVAINTDPAAPIFDLAKYGVEIDMFDLIEVLTTKAKEAKAG
ncbi:MAG: electron transfer flavoprotein subunit alpha/FixB family protein [Chloroflexota bacterium]